MELKLDAQARGTRILALGKARKYRMICNALMHIALETGAEELILPMIEPVSLHSAIADQLITFQVDPDDDRLCIRPNGYATCLEIARTVYKKRRDMKAFYTVQCFRRLRPELGRHHEFTQFGYMMLNPRSDPTTWMKDLARRMVGNFTANFSTLFELRPIARPEEVYKGEGFEIACEMLGGQKQVCMGGPYPNGYGFEITIERLMLV